MGNAQVIDLIVQKGNPSPSTYIGPGKAVEVGEFLKTHPVDVIIIGGILTPNQKFNLTKTYWDINPKIAVWDRVDLILAIFSRHAHTQEAILQIDLARMRSYRAKYLRHGKNPVQSGSRNRYPGYR